MKTAQWPQDLVGVRPMEELVANPKPKSTVERKVRPSANCPRCNSTNTKFCYYNNYSLSQPRFFCKTCRRYWTEGGTLRNIPVGGGTRKHNKKSSSSTSTTSSSTTSSKKLFQDSVPLLLPNPNHFMSGPPQDLNLGFSSTDFRTINELIQVPNFDLGNPNSSPSTSPPTTTTLSRGLMSSFMSMPNITNTDPNSTVYSSSTSSTAFPNFPAFIKPSLNFSLDGLGSSNYGSFQGVVEQETNGKLLFPFADLNQQVSSSNNAANEHADDDQNREQPDNGDHATGYWNGVIGTAGGSW